MLIRGIRGAVVVSSDEPFQVKKATLELFETILKKNLLNVEDVAAVFITITPDIQSVFPAEAIREQEKFRYVPIMCAQEAQVAGGLQRCIRIMVLANTPFDQETVRHVYLGEAKNLRKDLFGGVDS
ncbi:MAG: chorismate mutase [Candidatus Atribacteria bacterium]|nr:chorismate mutase [Candidatus Atribacteria bacterium]MCD6350249.1 chorismate mutase [Candidatus Atribacteria bacterium]